MRSNSTGVSMSGGIVNTNRVKPIPCNCMKCYHKRRMNGVNYCMHYQKEIDKNRKRCSRYYGEKVEGPSSNKVSKTCKKCKHYDLKARFCNSFSMDVYSTSTGKYCKNYQQTREEIPKPYKYKHNSSKTKWNKYKTKK